MIATHVAEGAPKEKTMIIDAFAGAGGNAIAFALSGRWERVFAIEKDPKVLKCAKHNADVYGLANKIWWIQGDCFDVIKKRFSAMGKSAIIFASPPWGGRSLVLSLHYCDIANNTVRAGIHVRRCLQSIYYAAVQPRGYLYAFCKGHQRYRTVSSKNVRPQSTSQVCPRG